MKILILSILCVFLYGCNKEDVKTQPICVKIAESMSEEDKALKTESGVDLDFILKNGRENPSAKIGCYIPSIDSYIVFRDLFERVVAEYHHFDPKQVTQICGRNVHNLIIPIDFKPKNEVYSTRFRITRNIEGFNFTPKMTPKERLEVEKTVLNAISKTDLKGKYYKIKDIKPDLKQQLIASGLLFDDAINNPDFVSSGIADNWSIGRGAFISDDKRIAIWINEEDHVKVISLRSGYDFYHTVKDINPVLSVLSKNIHFAYKPGGIGYLTSSLDNIGTGAKASILMLVPKNKTVSKIKKYLLQKNILLQTKDIDNLTYIQISNAVTFGVTEIQLINDMHNKLLKDKII